MLSMVIIILSLLQFYYSSCPQSSASCADVEMHMEHLILTYLPLGPCCALPCFLPSKIGKHPLKSTCSVESVWL